MRWRTKRSGCWGFDAPHGVRLDSRKRAPLIRPTLTRRALRASGRAVSSSPVPPTIPGNQRSDPGNRNPIREIGVRFRDSDARDAMPPWRVCHSAARKRQPRPTTQDRFAAAVDFINSDCENSNPTRRTLRALGGDFLKGLQEGCRVKVRRGAREAKAALQGGPCSLGRMNCSAARAPDQSSETARAGGRFSTGFGLSSGPWPGCRAD